MKRTSERIIKLHLLVQFVLNFSNNSVSSLFFRAFRIFCPKAVKSSIGIIVHLKNIVSFRFTQRNNLIVLVERYDYADYVDKNSYSDELPLSWWQPQRIEEYLMAHFVDVLHLIKCGKDVGEKFHECQSSLWRSFYFRCAFFLYSNGNNPVLLRNNSANRLEVE